MTTIHIAYEVSDATVEKIEAFLAKTAAYDVNWNGARFEIERDDFTFIPDDESIEAVSLYAAITDIIHDDEYGYP